MMRRVLIASLVCSIALVVPVAIQGQSGSMSDASGATVGLFSRALVRAFPAAPAPPPELVVSAEILDALCVERSDAMLVYAGLSGEAFEEPERNVVALLRGGAEGTEARNRMQLVLVEHGADRVDAWHLVTASEGLLEADQPTVPDVATAVGRYNELVRDASPAFLADPSEEFLALRDALGRLTAASNAAFASERVYPDLPPADVGYANDADWQIEGRPLELMDEIYLQFGEIVETGNRRFRQVDEHEGVWVLAEATYREGPPDEVFVPLRRYCDVVLQPYVMAEPVAKDTNRRR